MKESNTFLNISLYNPISENKMKKPEISVIMPVYNAEQFLDKSIRSILDQTFRNFEFIIIDDGSIDKSKTIIRGYQKKDKRIKLIRNIRNLGLQKTLNKGLNAARGKYIARMDADDISLLRRLEMQKKYLDKNKEIFLVGSSAIVIDKMGERLGVFRKYDNYKKVRKKLEKNNCIIHPSIMFRNKGFKYRTGFKASEDYDLYLRILSSGERITNLPYFLIQYRITKESFVSTTPNQEFFYKKAKEFYFQRKIKGKDSYAKLDPPGRSSPKINFKKNYLWTKISVEFQDNKMSDVRKDALDFLLTYGLDMLVGIYFLLSFIPYRITNSIRKNIL